MGIVIVSVLVYDCVCMFVRISTTAKATSFDRDADAETYDDLQS